MRYAAELTKELKPAHAWHIQVERDQIGSMILNEGPRRGNIGSHPYDDAVRIAVSDLLDQGPYRCGVVNDEKTYGMHGRLAFAVSADCAATL